MSENNTVDTLAPLIEQARAERKWLWCYYQDIWFSPDQLAEQNANGKFLWSPINWKLRDPQERVAEADKRADQARRDADRVRRAVETN
jgi:hypothetical protein